MTKYFEQMEAPDDLKAALLITEYFPYPWMGGNRAVRQATRICGSKGVELCGSGIVNWSKSRREEQIVEVVDRLSGLF
jgi:hypothetical protein